MSRLHRIRRHAGQAVAEHDRARNLAAERLVGPLEPSDDRWLEAHLATCASCRSVAASYETDRIALRSLRDRAPRPPRDLWARTAAALEREAAGGGTQRVVPGQGRRWPAVGILSGVAVVVIVVGATVLSGGFLARPPTTADVPSESARPAADASDGVSPGPTPFAVGAGSVGWFGTAADGAFAYNVTSVDEVCPPGRKPICAPVFGRDAKRVDIAIRPRSITKSPVRDQAVVVGTDASGADAVYVIALPTADAGPVPTTSSQPTVAPSAAPTEPPTTAPSEPPTTAPSSAAPTETTTPSASSSPSLEPTTAPTVEPSPTLIPSIEPSQTPEPTVAATLAIVSGVTVVGESAAYSPDGTWFAFTARPSDASAGPDIYVWHVGDERARAVTDDHASVFASWSGNKMIGSRPVVTRTETAEVSAESFELDPRTGKTTSLDGSLWRPVVDPAGEWVLTWDGTVRISGDGLSITPAGGALVLERYERGVGKTGSLTPGDIVTDDAVAEFDARWDETGTWLAIWLADSSDPSIGRLSLMKLDRRSGKLERPDGAPKNVTALPGFSIADGRLAWATPRGQGGEGSRVQIVAWTDQEVGAVESGPVEDVVVIH